MSSISKQLKYNYIRKLQFKVGVVSLCVFALRAKISTCNCLFNDKEDINPKNIAPGAFRVKPLLSTKFLKIALHIVVNARNTLIK